MQSTILVIDPMTDHGDLLQRFLGASGYAVVVATTLHAALNLISQYPIDLIVVALSYPGAAHWEEISTLSQQVALQIPILGTTMFAPLVTHARTRSIGIFNYVEKPFDFEVLLKQIMALLPPK
jgi:DNA-binding response OmpR family regulator